jgi:acetoacetyl-CoA synthetase
MMCATGEHLASEVRARATRVTYGQLRALVYAYRNAMRAHGIRCGDRVGRGAYRPPDNMLHVQVAGYLPNCPQTVALMLAAASLGAVWSCASPDFGATAVIDRFGQLQPRLLFSVDAVVYNGRVHEHLQKVHAVVNGMPIG